jgi:hypothetical protein
LGRRFSFIEHHQKIIEFVSHSSELNNWIETNHTFTCRCKDKHQRRCSEGTWIGE